MTIQLEVADNEVTRDRKRATASKFVKDWEAHIIREGAEDVYLVTVYCCNTIEAWVRFDDMGSAQTFIDKYLKTEAGK